MPWVRAHWRNPPGMGGSSGTGCGVLGCCGVVLVGFMLWALANLGSSPSRTADMGVHDRAALQAEIAQARARERPAPAELPQELDDPTPSVQRASPVARERATEQSHPSRPDLPARDVGLVDTRGGWEWSGRCFRNIQAGNLRWARSECVMGVNLPADSPRPMSSLLYNLGLIEEREGATESAADFYQRSLALYEHPDVRAALARLR